ncbi:NADH-quinone oxidoreductase subunit A [Mechercharimyces sp. CAU 1602]|uniref:NADH-quinone oxidoreductase subunit A n=1 Tax=Mechercharimyces sp. CAU 1602 TaxID=2973933 RepID=UPI002162D7E9|nr:NADH-quinone oxidoreductase subunit A [Mechercharimyces sp. CAU 1602]MCS1352277.1 NADH-quinone oxidoreductase subunit A [Mechercharimyces sp. CAU 1602]
MIAYFIFIGVALPVIAFTLSRWLRPDFPSEEKRITYESGAEPVGDSWIQFNVRYYLFALLFVIFEVEAAFLYPWATAYDTLRDEIGLFVLFEMGLFLFMLIVGLLYAWKKKVFEWE